jgi:hypothetical protein
MLHREPAGGLVKQTTGKIKKKFFTDRSFSRCSGQKYFLFLQIFLWMFCTVNFFSPLTDCSLDVLDKETVFSSYRSFSGFSGQRFFFFSLDLSQMDVQENENFAPVIDLSLDVQEKKQSLNLIPPLL